ncbi:hypothetical protein HK101_008171 [Irineochytrium annulatum]|nr:hypothetical protein HK101_008171 [Irineochytrium annulatum]
MLRVLGAVLAFGLARAAPLTSSALVTIPKLGTLQGSFNSATQTNSFLGVPYAATQSSANRFSPAQPATPWSGTRSATALGSQCVQTNGAGSEDCLFLNVYAPVGGKNLPVVGSAHGMDGDSFVAGSKGGVILVTIQYRLNAFGFLFLESLKQKGWTNIGLRDQQLAFEWVRANIAAFGGDPNRVTASGESAGATSVGTHLVAYNGTQKYFQRAIMESGSPTSGPRIDSQPYANSLLSASGCSDSADVVSCLRAIPVSTFASLAGNYLTNIQYEPVVDGTFLTADPADLLAAGAYSKVPVLLGSNQDEGTVFVSGKVGNGYDSWLSGTFQPQYGVTTAGLSTIKSLYPLSAYNNSVFQAAAAVYGQFKYVCQVRALADLYSKAGLTVYKYRFTYVRNGDVNGAYHAEEVNFLFNPKSLSASEQPLSSFMISSWSSFVANGNPNFSGAPLTWKPYVGSSSAPNGGGKQMNLNVPVSGLHMEAATSQQTQCTFWTSFRNELTVKLASFTAKPANAASPFTAVTLSGTVRLRNVAYAKAVTVRALKSDGSASGSIAASYVAGVAGTDLETWSFSGIVDAARFYVEYQIVGVAGLLFMDDNNGLGYQVNAGKYYLRKETFKHKYEGANSFTRSLIQHALPSRLSSPPPIAMYSVLSVALIAALSAASVRAQTATATGGAAPPVSSAVIAQLSGVLPLIQNQLNSLPACSMNCIAQLPGYTPTLTVAEVVQICQMEQEDEMQMRTCVAAPASGCSAADQEAVGKVLSGIPTACKIVNAVVTSANAAVPTSTAAASVTAAPMTTSKSGAEKVGAGAVVAFAAAMAAIVVV